VHLTFSSITFALLFFCPILLGSFFLVGSVKNWRSGGIVCSSLRIILGRDAHMQPAMLLCLNRDGNVTLSFNNDRHGFPNLWYSLAFVSLTNRVFL